MEDLSTEALFGGMVGKNVVVTGGSSGIGLMISAAFVQAGCNVYIFSRRPDHAAAAALTSKGPGRCISLVCDVANDAQISEVVKLVGERCPEGLHVLVNNSGAVWAAAFEETSKSSFDKLMNVNVTGLFMVTQKFTPLLTRAATAQDPARVINIASYVRIDGLGVPTFEEYAYTASKAAVIHLTRTMAGHLAQKKILFNSVSPGLFPSKMGDQVINAAGDAVSQSIPVGRPGLPREIAGAVLFLASPAGTYCAGTNIVVDGGMLAKPRM